jgi:Protein of unknown function (DUF3500)
MPTPRLFHASVVILFASLFSLTAFAQPNNESLTERFQRMSDRAQERGLSEPFKGVTTHGETTQGIFPVRATGVSTQPARSAAKLFLNTLNKAQRGKTLFSVDDPEWRKWMNQHFYVRQGIGFNEMDEKQREAAFNLLSASLSAKGLKLTKDIMKLNHTLGELNNNNFVEFNEWLYWITIMGKPSSTEPWGWQLDGHHVIINYFVLGDQVVMTPLFVGSEPVTAESGKYKGVSILQDEQKMGLTLLRSLNKKQRKQATIQVSKDRNNNLGEAFKDNLVLDYTGVNVSSFTKEQRQKLLTLIALYIDNQSKGHAKVRMKEIEQHLDDTFFAWIGGSEDDAVYYYRIHSPVVLIEFDHQRPIGLRHLYGKNKPSRQHIHAVVRTPNGNDYGKDLLRQHYKNQDHTNRN